jgi:hypothetical protein
MSEYDYIVDRVVDSSLVEFGKADSPSVWERGGLVTDNQERKARIKGALPGIGGIIAGGTLAHRAKTPRMKAAGLGAMLGGYGAGMVGAHVGGNKARAAQGKKERNALGFIGKSDGALIATGRTRDW